MDPDGPLGGGAVDRVVRAQLPRRDHRQGGHARRTGSADGPARRIACSDGRAVHGLARSGVDEDFKRGESAYDRYYGDPTNKPKPNLGELTHAPYYTAKLVPGDLGTTGGVRTDVHGRALRDDDSIIEGLYAAGNASSPANTGITVTRFTDIWDKGKAAVIWSETEVKAPDGTLLSTPPSMRRTSNWPFLFRHSRHFCIACAAIAIRCIRIPDSPLRQAFPGRSCTACAPRV